MLDLIFICWLLVVWLALLYWELRSQIEHTTNWKRLRRTGFHFGFWAGIFWGIFIASYAFTSWFADPIRFFGYLAGWIAWGIIFGLLGMAITQFMLILIFRLPEEK